MIRILGTDLAHVSGVLFNGGAAVFTLVSRSEIVATVPAAASSGKLQVITPAGTLTGNARFRVLP
jgi:hypothetical protein